MPERDAEKMAGMPEHLPRGGGGTAEGKQSAHQAGTACNESVGTQRFATMEEVVRRDNMLAAYRRVMGNRGAAGVDGMHVDELMPMLRERWEAIREALLDGTYKPQPVLGVEIPKASGKGVRG